MQHTASLPPVEPVDLDEAKAFAGRFAADYYSSDGRDPRWKAKVLQRYFEDPAVAEEASSWGASGRQSADIVLPGRCTWLAPGRVQVEVSVRVQPYRAVDDALPVPAFDGLSQGEPATAPPPDIRAWQPTAAVWVDLAPVITRTPGGRLVVDIAKPDDEPPF